ncbi:MAG: GIY-YIG nuclease family protein [Chitinophagales bacterium]|nr:GIY-YIG nuclease family protein [Chitinophagales bacterium]
MGVTQDDLNSRIAKHNASDYGNKYTSQASDWTLFHYIEWSSYAQAINIERHIKRMKSRKYIEDLIKYPNISINLVLKYIST